VQVPAFRKEEKKRKEKKKKTEKGRRKTFRRSVFMKNSSDGSIIRRPDKRAGIR